MRIVETDNFGDDYPDEKFLPLFYLPKDVAEKICNLINDAAGEHSSRYWKVVENDYKLQPGFVP